MEAGDLLWQLLKRAAKRRRQINMTKINQKVHNIINWQICCYLLLNPLYFLSDMSLNVGGSGILLAWCSWPVSQLQLPSEQRLNKWLNVWTAFWIELFPGPSLIYSVFVQHKNVFFTTGCEREFSAAAFVKDVGSPTSHYITFQK